MLCPERRDKNGKPEEPSESELNHIRNDKAKLKVIRSRLSDISWWMRLLSQNIAQRANREDGEVGKFFQARYRAVRLLDETAILACAAYVDLNPIRAAIAETVEDSDFTSAQKRAAELRREFSVTSVQFSEISSDGDKCCVGDTGNTVAASERTRRSSRHLAPVQLVGGSSSTGACVHKQGARCSNKGFLPMSTADSIAFRHHNRPVVSKSSGTESGTQFVAMRNKTLHNVERAAVEG